MSEDGADLGVTAERALKTVIGGADQPNEEEKMDPAAFEAYVMSQTEPVGYGGTAAYAAKLILLHLRAHPDDARIPVEPEFERDAAGKAIWKDDGLVYKPGRNLTDVMFEYPEFKALDLTGFMWGWAVNAARRICELEPVPNPAIVTIG